MYLQFYCFLFYFNFHFVAIIIVLVFYLRIFSPVTIFINIILHILQKKKNKHRTHVPPNHSVLADLVSHFTKTHICTRFLLVGLITVAYFDTHWEIWFQILVVLRFLVANTYLYTNTQTQVRLQWHMHALHLDTIFFDLIFCCLFYEISP